MKDIRFFAPEENVAPRKKRTTSKSDKSEVTGYITSTGKVIIPQKSAEEVGLKPEESAFKIGMPENKRKLKSLYLVPTSRGEEGVFEMHESGRNYFLPLGVILEKGGLDVQNKKYTFNINTFQYGDDNKTAFELKLNKPTTKTKRPGRKPKND